VRFRHRRCATASSTVVLKMTSHTVSPGGGGGSLPRIGRARRAGAESALGGGGANTCLCVATLRATLAGYAYTARYGCTGEAAALPLHAAPQQTQQTEHIKSTGQVLSKL